MLLILIEQIISQLISREADFGARQQRALGRPGTFKASPKALFIKLKIQISTVVVKTELVRVRPQGQLIKLILTLPFNPCFD